MKTLLIDTSYLIYRSYFAYPHLTFQNTPVGAFFGFAKGVIALVKEFEPDQLVFACDRPEPTWRHQQYDGYKAGRAEIEPDMISQFPFIKEFAQKITDNYFEQVGWEADDFINTLAKEADKDTETLVFSADKDLYQLFQFPQTHVIHAKKLGGFELFTKDDFVAKYELQPLQWLDYKTLVGDNSDNLPGVPGIGPKTATKILKEIGCLANLTQALNLSGFDFVPIDEPHKTNEFIANQKNLALVEKIMANIETLRQTYKLAGLSLVPNTKLKETGYNLHRGLDLIQQYNFKSIITQIQSFPTEIVTSDIPLTPVEIVTQTRDLQDDGALF